MRPYCENNCSNSFWVIVFGRPLTYKFASLIDAELGRAYDTYGFKKRKCVLVSRASLYILNRQIVFFFHKQETLEFSCLNNPGVQILPVRQNQENQERLEEQRKSKRDLENKCKGSLSAGTK